MELHKTQRMHKQWLPGPLLALDTRLIPPICTTLRMKNKNALVGLLTSSLVQPSPVAVQLLLWLLLVYGLVVPAFHYEHLSSCLLLDFYRSEHFTLYIAIGQPTHSCYMYYRTYDKTMPSTLLHSYTSDSQIST